MLAGGAGQDTPVELDLAVDRVHVDNQAEIDLYTLDCSHPSTGSLSNIEPTVLTPGGRALTTATSTLAHGPRANIG